MRLNALVCTLAVAAAIAAPVRLNAADSSDLAINYDGPAHSITDPSLEDVGIDIGPLVKGSGGKFTGAQGNVPVSGKVSSTGKVTYKGSLKTSEGGDDVNIKVATSAQLSATGRFLVGSTSIKGKINGQPVNLRFVFSADDGSVATVAGESAQHPFAQLLRRH